MAECPNCGDKGPHYIPPGLGSGGFFMCQSKEEKEEMLVMRRYRRKPISIEAVQWGGSTTWNDLVAFSNYLVRYEGDLTTESVRFFVYDRLHDTWVEFTYKDWIIKGTQNEFYPIKDDVFRECYEREEMEK